MTSVGAGTMDNPNHILYPPWHVVVVSSILRALDENIINEPFLFVHNDDGYRTNGRNDSCDSLGGRTSGGGTGGGTGEATGVRRGEATPAGGGDAGTGGGITGLAGGVAGGVATASGVPTTGFTGLAGGTSTAAGGGAAGGAGFTLRIFSLVFFIDLPPRW